MEKIRQIGSAIIFPSTPVIMITAAAISPCPPLLAGKTVLVIAHRMRTVEAADKIVVLSEGRVTEQGTPSELMKQSGLFRHMVELQRQSAGWRLK